MATRQSPVPATTGILDALKSIGSGALQGMASVPDLAVSTLTFPFRQSYYFLKDESDRLAGRATPQQLAERERERGGLLGNFLSGATPVQDALGITGLDYQPESLAGEYLKTGASFAAPGGLLGRAGTVADRLARGTNALAAGLVSEGAGQFVSENIPQLEPYARFAGAMLTPNVVRGGAIPRPQADVEKQVTHRVLVDTSPSYARTVGRHYRKQDNELLQSLRQDLDDVIRQAKPANSDLVRELRKLPSGYHPRLTDEFQRILRDDGQLGRSPKAMSDKAKYITNKVIPQISGNVRPHVLNEIRMKISDDAKPTLTRKPIPGAAESLQVIKNYMSDLLPQYQPLIDRSDIYLQASEIKRQLAKKTKAGSETPANILKRTSDSVADMLADRKLLPDRPVGAPEHAQYQNALQRILDFGEHYAERGGDAVEMLERAKRHSRDKKGFLKGLVYDPARDAAEVAVNRLLEQPRHSTATERFPVASGQISGQAEIEPYMPEFIPASEYNLDAEAMWRAYEKELEEDEDNLQPAKPVTQDEEARLVAEALWRIYEKELEEDGD